MRKLTPLQFLVVAAARGRDELRRNAIPVPAGFDDLFDGLKVAALADPTTVTTNRTADTTPGDDGRMNELISLDRAAGETGRSRRTLERRITAGVLPAHREGRRVYVRRGDLEDI